MLQWLIAGAAVAALGRGGARAQRYELRYEDCYRFTVEVLFDPKDWGEYGDPEKGIAGAKAALKQYGGFHEASGYSKTNGGRVRLWVRGSATWLWPDRTVVIGAPLIELTSPNNRSKMILYFTRLEPCDPNA